MRIGKSKFLFGVFTFLIAVSFICISVDNADARRRRRRRPPPPVSETVGTVEQVIQNEEITIVQINNGSTLSWVATPSIQVSVGDSISLRPGNRINGQHMRRLNRTFDSIIYSDGPN